MQFGDDGVAAVGVHDARTRVSMLPAWYSVRVRRRLWQKLKTWLRRQWPSSRIHRRSEAKRSAGTSFRAYSLSDGEMYATNFS